MDLKRYQDAWAKNAIQRQTLEDQEKVVLQDQGTVKNDRRDGALRPGGGGLTATSPRRLAGASGFGCLIPATW